MQRSHKCRGPINKENAWASRFERALQESGMGYAVKNMARDGYSSFHLLPNDAYSYENRPAPDQQRNISRACEYDPVAVVINLPSNDNAYGYQIQEQLANYDTILARADRRNVPVWVTTTQPRNFPESQKRQAQLAMRDSTFRKFGDRAIDFWTGLAADSGYLRQEYDSGDGVHCNDAAHAIFAERIKSSTLWDYLQKRAMAASHAAAGDNIHAQRAL